MNKGNEVTILVVDNDSGHSELIRRNLVRAGVTNKILTVTSGEKALDFVYSRGEYENRCDFGRLLILLDISMPGMDGVEVLTRLKKDPEKAKIPVIMLTTTDDPREVQRCYDIGCSIYITKPVSSERFIDAINRLGLFISVAELPEEGAVS